MEQSRVGAVRVEVKLTKSPQLPSSHGGRTMTNAIDRALVNRGLLAPHLLRECETQALVDTGALTLVIPSETREQLGLRIRGQQVARYANGFEEPVGVTEPVTVVCQGRQTSVEALVVGDEVLIGSVVLELLDCKNQRLILNPANPDYPVATIKRLAVATSE